MNEQTGRVAELIESGAAVLGIEFGSTRIKAALIAPDTTPLASGSYAWENQLRDGVWTYDMADVWKGLAACYASLVEDVRARYGTHLRTVASLGISGMMHGYVALDGDGNLLVPFRTWRNNITGAACAELTPLLDFAVPQRWSIAHLYQSILDGQPHLSQLAHLKTLAAYVHWRLTGEHVVGLDEASGMFPIDPVTQGLGRRPDGDVRRADRAARASAGRCATSCPPSCPPAPRPAPSPPRAPGCSTRRARSRPASRSARPRATRAPAWSPPTPSGPGPATSRPAPRSSR